MSDFAGVDEPDNGDLEVPALVDEADLILPKEETDNGITPPPAPGSPPRAPFEGAGVVPSFPLSRGTSSLPDGALNLARPFLGRESSVPAPRQPPPPAPPPQIPAGSANPSGSPSLTQQVKKLASELPRLDPTPYAFTYQDASTLPEELEEWFSYTIDERAKVSIAQQSFTSLWSDWNKTQTNGVDDWIKTSADKRAAFVVHLKEAVVARTDRLRQSIDEDGPPDNESESKLRYLEALIYLALGCWNETAGLDRPSEKQKPDDVDQEDGNNVKEPHDPFSKSHLQLEWIKTNTLMILADGGANTVFDIFKATTDREFRSDTARLDTNSVWRQMQLREVWCSQTLLYVCLEIIRITDDKKSQLSLRSDFLSPKQNLVVYLAKIVNDLRWDDSIQLSSIKVILLMWKSALVLLGGYSQIEAVKSSFQEKNPARDNLTKPHITASPLDYHSFRQEISSKYPAYNPPPSTFQLEPEQKSMLPPLRQNQNRPTSAMSSSEYGGSIMNQPVHIATPAPSPPPSPAAKGGKKQNYQTNQLFPFLYPPLDATSNQLGGKGTTSLQDSFVNRRWKGPDVPTSILEASELFSARIRTTRALKQLWDARSEYLKYDRGWADETAPLPDFEIDDDEMEKLEKRQEEKKREYDGSVEERLETVEDFYVSVRGFLNHY
jgi:hypothetical protein